MNLLDAANFGLWIVLGILFGTLILLPCIGWLMKRSGVSRKPLYWFPGFMSLVLLPQLAGHLINAYMRTPRPTEPMAASTEARVNFPSDFDYTDPQKLTSTVASSRQFPTLTHSISPRWRRRSSPR